jgi:DNA (cytosine-5)-methyltransferase 1
MQLTFGSLFAGIGGFDLGFERAGFECRWQVEIDNYATKILEKHWPKVHRQRDIRKCNASNLERVDCIIGGFPCQDISYAGRGAGLDGERSGLFFEAIRLVRELQPRAIVLENVAALLTRGLDRVLGTLAEIGYDAEWHCIPAAAVGAPHIRDRVFVIAYSVRDSYGINDSAKQARHPKDANAGGASCGSDEGESPDVADAMRQGPPSERNEAREQGGPGERSENVADAEIEGLERRAVRRDFGSRSPGLMEGGRPVSEHWSVEPAVGRVANGIPSRVDRLRCLGNAIVPQVAEVVARMALERLG